MKWSDGTTYFGDWLLGKMHGRGSLKSPNNEELTGIFHHNRFIGREVADRRIRTPKKLANSQQKKSMTLPLLRDQQSSASSMKRSRSESKFTDERSPISDIKQRPTISKSYARASGTKFTELYNKRMSSPLYPSSIS